MGADGVYWCSSMGVLRPWRMPVAHHSLQLSHAAPSKGWWLCTLTSICTGTPAALPLCSSSTATTYRYTSERV